MRRLGAAVRRLDMPKISSRNPTVADVARACGVGTMTVSRVVNGSKFVRADTAARVRAAILKLGYQPNEAARVLKGSAPRAIGLIVPDLADPFFSQCAHAVQRTAMAEGYMTSLFASERDSRRELQEIAMMTARNMAGVIVVPSGAECVRPLGELRAKGLPVVLLDRTFPGVDAGKVMVDNGEGARRAVDHLIEHGHRRILCVGYDSKYNSIAQRIAGYERAMRTAELSPDRLIVTEPEEVGSALLHRLASDNPPTALFSLNNVTTTEVLLALKRERIAIPRQVALIGFDDLDLASLLAVPISAVRQSGQELGRSAVRLLLDWIGSGAASFAPAQRPIVLPTELVLRRSCGCGEHTPARTTISRVTRVRVL